MSQSGSLLSFGLFTFDIETCRLCRDGANVHLTPKAAAVLCYLLQRPGELISKDEFLEIVWEGVHVREESLTQAISVIRQTLGDSSQSPRYIQTVSGEGYRFIGEITKADPSSITRRPGGQGAARLRDEPSVFPPPLSDPAPLRPRRAPWMLIGAGLAIVSLVAVAWLLAPPSPASPAADPNVVPVTSFEGYEREPAISPDGKQVAFIWDGGADGGSQLYVKMLNGGSTPRQLTSGEYDHSWPAWSNEGNRIAYFRKGRDDPGYEVRAIFADGTNDHPLAPLPDCDHTPWGIDWSPDDRFLAFPGCSTELGPGIFLMSTHNGATEQITSAPQQPRPFIDMHPAFSPDGKALAFVRETFYGDLVHIYVQDLVDGNPSGEPRRLEFANRDNSMVHDVDWTAGGEGLVWSGGTTDAHSYLTRVSLAEQEERRLAVGERVQTFAIVDDLLVYTKWQEDYGIWRIGGPAADEAGAPERWNPSTWNEANPHYSSAGDRVTFSSDREGTMEVWVSDAEGRSSQKLTETRWTIQPEFSPSGEHIVYSGIVAGSGGARLYLMSAEGGFSTDLTGADVSESGPAWSDEGEWIYYQSLRGGGRPYEVWRIRPDGSDRAQITEGGVFCPRPYRGRLYFYRDGRIWSADAAGGDEQMVVDERAYLFAWNLWNGKLIYMVTKEPITTDTERPMRRVTIRVRDLETGETHDHAVVDFAPGGFDAQYELTVSPDGRFILYAGRERAGSDLMRVENFR